VRKLDAMSNDQEHKERQKGRGCVVAALVLVPILYVLSAGPAGSIHRHSPPVVQSALRIVYLPLSWVVTSIGHDSPVIEALAKYIDWCESWMP